MKIKFNRDFPHTDNGFSVTTYRAGTVVEVSDACAKAAIETKAGTKADEPVTPGEPREPEKDPPRLSKSIPGAPKNKAGK